MIVIDASPLAFGARAGVARALQHLVHGWAQLERTQPVVLLAPHRLPGFDVLDGVEVASPAPQSARAFRRSLPALVDRLRPRAFVSPWSACPRLSIPTFVSIHELPFVQLGPVEGRVRTWTHRRWLRENVRRAAALVTPSEATRADLLRLHPDARARVHVVPHGFDPEPWAAAERPDDEPRYAVVVGAGAGAGGHRKKGMDLLDDAWTHGDDLGLDLVVVDGGTLEHRARTAAPLRRPIDEDGLPGLVAGARVLVYPSRSEGFGFPPLEAMAAGVPVVATNVGAIPEVVGDAAVLVPPEAGALRDAVRRVDEDTSLRERLIAAGRERARAFPCARAAERWAALIEGVLAAS